MTPPLFHATQQVRKGSTTGLVLLSERAVNVLQLSRLWKIKLLILFHVYINK